MLQYVSGDILLSKAHAIAHGVAPSDHFDQGLALALREQWPAMVKDFRHWCHTHHPKTGQVWEWAGAGGVRIVNLLTQESAEDAHRKHPGRASLENVNHVLRALRQIIVEQDLKSVALPRIATGVGGLDWSDVEPLIKHHLGDLKIPVVVYSEYHKGVAASESLA